jgi:hypothetical protein
VKDVTTILLTDVVRPAALREVSRRPRPAGSEVKVVTAVEPPPGPELRLPGDRTYSTTISSTNIHAFPPAPGCQGGTAP